MNERGQDTRLLPDLSPGDESLERLRKFHERTLAQLQTLVDDVASPEARTLVLEVRKAAGLQMEDPIAQVMAKLEEAVRAVQFLQSEIQRQNGGGPRLAGGDHPANLPAYLSRFLAEREGTPGFHFEVTQDLERGWVIHWKEYTERGTVRGSGHFSERPYAWLDE